MVQAEYISLLTQPAVVRREAVQLRIDGYRFDRDQAAELVRLIRRALELGGLIEPGRPE